VDTAAHRPIANRAPGADPAAPFTLPSDGFVHLAPRGNFPHPSGLTQILDDAAIAAITSQFDSARAANPAHPGLLVDYDHFSLEPDRSSEAAGWITAIDTRPDGLWAQIRWTPEGRAAVANGRYRFLSPVFSRVQTIDDTRVRPLELAAAGLTNAPNLKTLAPLSNRHTTSTPTTVPPQMKAIAIKLGLAPEAAEDTILAAIETLQTGHTAAAAAAEAAKTSIADLRNRNTALLDDQVATLLDAHRITDTAKRDKLIPVLKNMASREDRVAFLKDILPPAAAAAAATTNQTHHHQRILTPGSTPAAPAGQELRILRNREVRALIASRACDFESAWNLLRSQRPELFAA
jgi:hypothetical protein